jgi:predicted AAA+ superfamily ATPase
MFGRWIESDLAGKLSSPYVQMMFGARQTGKSTLLQKLIPKASMWLDFSAPRQRSEYLRDPGALVEQCRGLPASAEPHIVVVDEARAVPGIFDAVQHLYDSDKRRWRRRSQGSSSTTRRFPRTRGFPSRNYSGRFRERTRLIG